MFPDIHEGVEGDEFGVMETTDGAGDAYLLSPLLGRTLDTSFQEAQDTPTVMETEIVRRTEEEVVRLMSTFQHVCLFY